MRTPLARRDGRERRALCFRRHFIQCGARLFLGQQLELQIDGSETDVALDLRQVRIVDREAVRFLARCETEGIELLECPPFVRAWIQSEQNSK